MKIGKAVKIQDITGAVLQTLDEDVVESAARSCNLKVSGVNTDATFQSYCAAEQKLLQPTKLKHSEMRARVNAPLPVRSDTAWRATTERAADDKATIFGWSARQLKDPKTQEAMEHMRVARQDQASLREDNLKLSDKDLANLPGHLASLDVTVCMATDSCPTIMLGEYQRLKPGRPDVGSYLDTRIFSAAAHHLAYGSNVPVGHRIFFADEGMQKLLMHDRVTNGRLLRGLQVSYSHPHPHPRPHPHPHPHPHRTFTSTLTPTSTLAPASTL